MKVAFNSRFIAVYGCAVPARQCQFRGITTRLSHTSYIGPVSSGRISSISPFLEEVIETSIETLTVVRRNVCGCGSLAGKDDRSLGHHERLLVELIVLQALTAATPGWVHGLSHLGELTQSGALSATSAAKPSKAHQDMA